MRTLLLLLSFAIFCSSLASAENRFCLGGELDRLSATERQVCNAQIDAARKIVGGTSSVDGWHFVIVCGDSAWQDYSAFAHNDATLLQGTSFDTDLPSRTMYLRSGSLQASNPTGLSEIKLGLGRITGNQTAH